jgi:putative glutamine amidotransferase
MVNHESNLLVAVSLRVDQVSDYGEKRDAIDHRLIEWIEEAGFTPILIPNVLVKDERRIRQVDDGEGFYRILNLLKPRAVILSGGNDIGKQPNRDITERKLLAWASVNRVPLLGICRGMQMMAVWAGAKLAIIDGHVRTRHTLKVPTSKEEWPINANSYHEWSIIDCPEGYEVMAMAEDGCIEAIRHKFLPWEGWMWHPERENTFNPVDIARIRKLFHGKN